LFPDLSPERRILFYNHRRGEQDAAAKASMK
jgi:hypothetical protein